MAYLHALKKMSSKFLFGHHSRFWNYDMETLSSLLAICEGNPPVTVGFPTQMANNLELWCLPDCYLEHQQRNYKPFVRKTQQWLVDSSHKGLVMWKAFPCREVIMDDKVASNGTILFQIHGSMGNRSHWIFYNSLKLLFIMINLNVCNTNTILFQCKMRLLLNTLMFMWNLKVH